MKHAWGRREVHTCYCWENVREITIGRPGRTWMIVKWIYRKRTGGQWLKFGGLNVGPAVVTCESGDENYGFLKCGGFLD
jgi:hypothetical protein